MDGRGHRESAFSEAARQFRLDVGSENLIFLHVTLLPYVAAAAGAQGSHAAFRARASSDRYPARRHSLPHGSAHSRGQSGRRSRCMQRGVGGGDRCARRLEHLRGPAQLQSSGACANRRRKLGLEDRPLDFEDWERFLDRSDDARHHVRIAVCGKYVDLQAATNRSRNRSSSPAWRIPPRWKSAGSIPRT